MDYKSNEEDYVTYKIFPCDYSKNIIEIRNQCYEIVEKFVSKFMWHHDCFVLNINESETCGSGNLSDQAMPIIEGKVIVSDSVEDEWFIISLLFLISEKLDDVVIQVNFIVNKKDKF